MTKSTCPHCLELLREVALLHTLAEFASERRAQADNVAMARVQRQFGQLRARITQLNAKCHQQSIELAELRNELARATAGL